MKVELVAHTQPVMGGSPLDVAEKAAAVCYDSKPSKSHRIVKACVLSGHESVLEHLSFTFHISGVSRSLLAQITRHRLFSFSVRSQRYCDEGSCEMVMPKSFEKDEALRNIYNEAVEHASGFYGRLLACGAKKEDARAVLPNAATTEMFTTCNMRELMHFCNLRLCTRAQDEVRELARSMKDEVVKVVPEAAEWLVPSCERSDPPFCPENRGCGKHPSLKELLEGGKE